MTTEKSCGFIAYKRVKEINYYLLIKAHNGDIGFPKGHMESGESEIETAIRETKEETGIDVRVIEGFKRHAEYLLKKKNAIKHVIYFLGEIINDKIICQIDEISEAYLLPYSEAIKLVTFDEARSILTDAENFLATKKIRCAWEHNGDDTLLHTIDIIGPYPRGENLEVAISKMQDEIASYMKWIGKTPRDSYEIEITTDYMSSLNISDADSDILFDTEILPLTFDEYTSLKYLSLKSATDFLALFNSIPNKNAIVMPERKTFYGKVPRSAEEMYLHTKNVNSYYFGEIGINTDNTGDILECRTRGFEMLESTPNFLENRVFQGSGDELWTLRKLLRRFIWHDRIHAKAMYRMAIKIYNKEDIENPFCF